VPKDTFYNLNDEKKKRILNAAMQEFSAQRFSDASLNQIVKAAGIPWGSFYQYFNDKEDIYIYMLEEISKEKQKILGNTEVLNPDADVFEIIVQRTKESLELSRVKPQYVEIGMQMEMDNSEFMKKIRRASIEKYVKMIERDKERGLIKPETDSELVINMIFTFGLEEYFRNGLDDDRYLKKLNDVIKIIKKGIAK